MDKRQLDIFITSVMAKSMTDLDFKYNSDMKEIDKNGLDVYSIIVNNICDILLNKKSQSILGVEYTEEDIGILKLSILKAHKTVTDILKFYRSLNNTNTEGFDVDKLIKDIFNKGTK